MNTNDNDEQDNRSSAGRNNERRDGSDQRDGSMANSASSGSAPSSDGSLDNSQQIGGPSIDLKSDIREAVAPVKEAFAQAIDQKRDSGADRLEIIACAVKEAAPRFDREMPQVASYIRDAGDWVEKCASDIREQKFETLIESVGNFARSQPAAAFGVATLSGFVLSRFLKSGSASSTGAGGAPTAH